MPEDLLKEVVRCALAYQSASMALDNWPNSESSRRAKERRKELLLGAIEDEYEARKTVG
jgi:hypothetical protein